MIEYDPCCCHKESILILLLSLSDHSIARNHLKYYDLYLIICFRELYHLTENDYADQKDGVIQMN